MVLSAEEVSSAAENHVLNAMEQLCIDARGLQELFRTKKAAASACETKYSDALVQLRRQVTELEAGRDSAAEALANERSQNEEKFAEKLEAEIVARLPTIFDTQLRNLISDEELAASQPLPHVLLLHETNESNRQIDKAQSALRECAWRGPERSRNFVGLVPQRAWASKRISEINPVF
jgi:hypothetical protein